jgi:hypothetical protein
VVRTKVTVAKVIRTMAIRSDVILSKICLGQMSVRVKVDKDKVALPRKTFRVKDLSLSNFFSAADGVADDVQILHVESHPIVARHCLTMTA